MNKMKINRKTTRIGPLFTMVCILLLSIIPFGVCTSNVSTTRVIPAGYYLAYPFVMEEDDRLDVSFEVTLGGNLDINLWVVDSANYLRYKEGDSFYYKIKLERYVSYDFQYTAITSDTYYVIFSNTFSLFTSKTVDIDITYIPAPTFDFTTGLIIFIVLGAIAIAIYALIKHDLDSRKKREEAEKKNNKRTQSRVKKTFKAVLF